MSLRKGVPSAAVTRGLCGTLGGFFVNRRIIFHLQGYSNKIVSFSPHLMPVYDPDPDRAATALGCHAVGNRPVLVVSAAVSQEKPARWRRRGVCDRLMRARYEA